MTRKTGTHAAEAEAARIQRALDPEYELYIRSKTCYGGLDCRVRRKIEKIGSLMIDPRGEVLYASRTVRHLLAPRDTSTG